jgi:putative hemin transport protein
MPDDQTDLPPVARHHARALAGEALWLGEGTDWAGLLAALGPAGRVLVGVPCGPSVFEQFGRLSAPRIGPSGSGILRGEGLDLRLRLPAWACGVTDEMRMKDRSLPVLRVFDAAGRPVFTVHGTSAADHEVFRAALAGAASPVPPRLSMPAAPVAPVKDGPVDAEALRADWAAMTDVHQMGAVLERHGLNRLEAARRLGEPWARLLAPAGLEALLEALVAGAVPVAIFGSSPAATLVQMGAITRVMAAGGMLNILDPGFHLHLDPAQLATLWHLRIPSGGAVLDALAGLDAAGGAVLTVFPHGEDPAAWQALLAAMG